MKYVSVSTFALVALFSINPLAHATAIYSYLGNFYTTFEDGAEITGTYDETMRVSASITLASLLAANLPFQDRADSVLEFTFNDGRQTFTSNSSGVNTLGFFVATDSLGAIVNWGVGVDHDPTGSGLDGFSLIITSSGGDLARICPPDCISVPLNPSKGTIDEARVANPGVWQASTTVVPVPAAFGLLSLALGSLALRRRKLF